MRHRLGPVCLVILGLTTLCIGAHADEVSPAAFLKAANTNDDKTLSKEEVGAYAKKKFAMIEADHDKTLDAKELKGRLGAAGLEAADTDNDKTIDEGEFVTYAGKLFDAANQNSDNTLNLKELDTPAGKKLITLLQ